MAIFNEILTGRFNRGLQKIFAIKSNAPVRQLGGEITPTVETSKLIDLDHRFTAGWSSYAGIQNVAAGGAGNRSAAAITNPAGSGIIAVIEKVTFASGGADAPQLTHGAPGPANLTAGVAFGSRDIRQARVSSVLLSNSVNAGAISGFGVWVAQLAGVLTIDVIQTDKQELLLMPGDFYAFWANTLNQGLNTTVFWRERALEESEIK